jgi:hypothetical protein
MVRSKTKISLILLVASILCGITIRIFNKEDFTSDRYYKLDKQFYLDENDFQQIPDFFSEFEAAVFVGIIPVLDSTTNLYTASAILDRNKSWWNYNDSIYYDTLLRHEYYHSKLAYFWGEKAKEDLLIEATSSLQRAENIINYYQSRHIYWQHKYDNETNHSINKSKQVYWEYKIDSLNATVDSSCVVNSIFSNANIVFSSEPSHDTIINDSGTAYVNHTLDKYGMRFRLVERYDINNFTLFDTSNLKNFYKSQGFNNIKVSSTDYSKNLSTYCEDTSYNRKFFDYYYFENPFEYHLTVNYPLNSDSSIYYEKIKDNFLSSFTITDNKEYWINYIDNNASNDSVEISFSDKNGGGLCHVTFNRSSALYSKPSRINDSTYFMAVYHPNDTTEKIKSLMINDAMITNFNSNIIQTFLIPDSLIHENNNKIKVCYFLNLDESSDCKHHYCSYFSFEDVFIDSLSAE